MIENTITLTGSKARQKVRSGVNKVADTVKLTLGPEGKNAILPRTFNRGPRITNDGITVLELARQIKDPHERLAAEAFVEGSKKTNELAGDGTTGTAVLGQDLLNRVFAELPDTDVPSAGVGNGETKGVRALRKDMKDAKDRVIEAIKERAVQIQSIEDLEKIAIVSIGKEDEAIARTIARMVWEVARDADGGFIDNHVDVVEGYKGKVETEITKGMRFPAKLAHRAFINKPERFEMVAEDTAVLITNYKLDNPFEVIDILKRVQTPKIAFFAPGYSPMVIKSLVETTKNGLFCYPVLTPALRTEQLEDLAAYTGAKVIDKDHIKLMHTKAEHLGFAGKIVVRDTEAREDGVLLGGRGENSDHVKERIQILKEQVKEAKNELSRVSLEKRIANLGAAIGVVRVGATTEAELLYLKLKIEDGVYACKAALQEGYVKGGGLCLKEIAEAMEPNVLTESLCAPYKQIQLNAGGNLEISDTVIDSAKVVRLQVEHAVSVVSSMITTDIIIAEVPQYSPYDGNELIAKAVAKIAYYNAKHQGLLREAEDEAEADREKAFEEAMFNDK